MNIGFCTTDFDTQPLDSLFGTIAGLGASVTQFAFASAAECEYTPDDHIEVFDRIPQNITKKIVKAASAEGLRITAVNGTFNMAHPDADVRTEGIKRFEEFTKASADIGSRIITLCSGTRSTKTLWSYHPDNNGDGAWYDMSESMKRVCDIAEKHGMYLAIEPEASNVINTPQKARKLIDDIGSDKLKMIMDAANLFHVGRAHRENVEAVMTEAFENIGRDIILAHGKDIRDTDGIEFCATGEGIIDFELFGRLLGEYDCTCDFMLHGIYDIDKMPYGVEIARKVVEIKNSTKKV